MKKTAKKTVAAIATAGALTVGLGMTAGTASAAGPRDGGCVAANLSGLDGPTKASVARTAPGALSGVIQLHLDGELDLLGVC